jgi:hypothetical protein
METKKPDSLTSQIPLFLTAKESIEYQIEGRCTQSQSSGKFELRTVPGTGNKKAIPVNCFFV